MTTISLFFNLIARLVNIILIGQGKNLYELGKVVQIVLNSTGLIVNCAYITSLIILLVFLWKKGKNEANTTRLAPVSSNPENIL